MPSFEFQYARLTAQSAGVKPVKIQGDTPEFDTAFIAQAVSQVTPRMTYYAAYAWYCDDLYSMDELNRGMANWAWKRIQNHHQETSFKALEVARVTELAVLLYLYPWHEESRSLKQCAAWVRVAPQTWVKKYQRQRDIIAHQLHTMKSSAEKQLLELLSNEDVAINAR